MQDLKNKIQTKSLQGHSTLHTPSNLNDANLDDTSKP